MLKNKNIITNITRLFSSQAEWTKSNINSIYLDPYTLDLDTFTNVIKNNFKNDVTYSLLFKLRYIDNDSTQYGMAAKQRPFKLTAGDNKNSIENLFKDIINLFDIFVDRYQLDEVDLIQVLYIVTESIPELKLKNINKVALNREFFNIGKTKEIFSDKTLPLTLNTSYYGKLLTSDDSLTYLNIINKNNPLKLESLDKIDSMFLYKGIYIIINEKINFNTIERRIFSIDTGMLYFTLIDTILDNSFSRRINKTTSIISNDKVIKIFNNRVLSPIKYHSHVYKASSNPFIGTLDLETFVDNDGYAKVYAIGFYTNKEAENNEGPKTFYLDSNMSSNELTLKCIDSMLITKYNDYTFYVHNLGGFDGPFILNTLLSANAHLGFEYYKLQYNLIDNRILKLEIKVEKDIYTKKSGYYRIVILDSLKLLDDSLSNLCEAFGLEVVKGNFPHTFVNRDTLNYKGNTPSIEYWNDLNMDKYNQLYSKDWDLQKECLKYLDKDLISLYGIIYTFNKYVYENYGLQLTNCLTISRLALNIFLKNYLKDSKIPLISQNMYNDIKKAYFGGVSEVYRPYGENLYYYDVNSLYPFVALNPMPGLSCTFTDYIQPVEYNKELFGFYYCEVETQDNYLGLLPVHNNFELIMPNGKWKGWYFSEELNLAHEFGYKIKVIKGYSFNKELNVFNDYVNDFYKIKSVSKGAIRAINKSLLNNMLGRFGINIKKPLCDIVNKDKLNLLLQTREVISTQIIAKDKYLVTYYPSISKYLCEFHNLDYIKLLNENTTKLEEEFKDASIAVAAAVTSYARVFMSKIKLNILNNGGLIYYTDTDSIVTNKPLSDDLIGDGLGKFKLEHEVKEGYFISSKTYCLVLKDNSVFIKNKGLIKKSLTLEDFRNMYKGLNVVGTKQSASINYEKGSVVIKRNENVQIHYDAFKKRDKVFQNNRWIDTRPVSYINTESVTYNNEQNRKYNSKSDYNNLFCSCYKSKSLFKVIIYKTKFILNQKIYKYFILTIGILLVGYLLHIFTGFIIDIHSNYVLELLRIKGEHMKFILENRFTSNHSNSIDYSYLHSKPKINMFIDLKNEWRAEIKLLNKNNGILNTILNELSLNFNTLTSFFNSPNPNLNNTNTSLVHYLFEARTIHPNLNTHNALGIQGIEPYRINEVINMIDTYLLENRTPSLERLNYQSNILYILVNRLTPSLY
jgi:DNA polymerase type B, organellar and viral